MPGLVEVKGEENLERPTHIQRVCAVTGCGWQGPIVELIDLEGLMRANAEWEAHKKASGKIITGLDGTSAGLTWHMYTNKLFRSA